MWKLILLPFEWIYSLKFGQMYSHFCWLKTKAILSMILDHENLNLGCVRFHFCSLVSKSAIKSVKTQKMGFLQNTEKVRLKKNLYRRFYIYLSYSTIKSWKNHQAGMILASGVIFWEFSVLALLTPKFFEIQKFFFSDSLLIYALLMGKTRIFSQTYHNGARTHYSWRPKTTYFSPKT